MDKHRLDQHTKELSNLETEYLLALWSKAGANEWTAEGAQALAQVLRDRLGFLPSRGVNYEPAAIRPADTYYDRDRLEALSSRIDGISSIFLGVAILAGIAAALALLASLFALFQQPAALTSLLDVVYSFASTLPFLQAALVSATLAYVLRAISEGILLLIDVEENTRASQRAALATQTAAEDRAA
jgi:hypothetical protein